MSSPWAPASTGLLLAWAASCHAEGVRPVRHDAWLPPGKQEELVVTVDLDEAPPCLQPVDVLFLFDATGSMSNVIGSVRVSAGAIMGEVLALTRSARFAVASFADHSEPKMLWRPLQDFTEEPGEIRMALGALELANGHDYPEAYLHALEQSRGLSWREEAERYVVLFGDAPARDPGFYGAPTGVEPGPDGLPGTADDPTMARVAASLRGDGLRVLGVIDDTDRKPLRDLTRMGFEYLAEATGGTVRSVRRAREVPSAVRSALREGFRPQPALLVPPGWAEWVSVSEPRPGRGGRRFDFEVRLHPPPGSPTGLHELELAAVHAGEQGGGEIGRVPLRLRSGLAAIDWATLLPAAWLALGLLALLVRAVALAARPRSVEAWRANGQWRRVAGWAVTLVVLAAGVVLLGGLPIGAPPW